MTLPAPFVIAIWFCVVVFVASYYRSATEPRKRMEAEAFIGLYLLDFAIYIMPLMILLSQR